MPMFDARYFMTDEQEMAMQAHEAFNKKIQDAEYAKKKSEEDKRNKDTRKKHNSEYMALKKERAVLKSECAELDTEISQLYKEQRRVLNELEKKRISKAKKLKQVMDVLWCKFGLM
jgi:hypothetical protein